MTISAKIETITPAKAEKWLSQAANNRHIRLWKVTEYADAMKRGEWKLSGEAIKFNGENMVDGQHRLKAVIEAGKDVDMLVVRGLDTDVMEVLDTGVKRSLADLLRIRQEPNAVLLASTLVAVTQAREAIEAGLWPHKNTKRGVTNVAALTLLNNEPGIRESVRFMAGFSSNHRNGLETQPTVLAVAHYILSDIDEEDCEGFFKRLSGIEVQENSPIYKYRRKFDGGADMPRSRRDQMALTFKTWNYWRNGEFPVLLMWKPGGSKPERFPVPV